MSEKIRNDQTDQLFQGILSLINIEECYAFFSDLCTINEIQSLAQRLEVAELLENGKTYSDIGKVTGASTATISRVNRCLNYGSDGYRKVLKRLENQNNQTKE